MSDHHDHRLRQLAQALVADAPSSPSLEPEPDARVPYVDRRAAVPHRGRGRVLVAAAAVTALVVAGGVALGPRGSSTTGTDAGSGLLAPTTVVADDPFDPADHLLAGSYQLARGSTDDPTQNTITTIAAAEIPAGVIGADAALAAAPPPHECDDQPGCDPPFSEARLARYQGFGGYDSFDDVDGPGAGDRRHDVVVWVLVRRADDFALAGDPGNHRMVGALLIDATSGELVGAGTLLPGA